MNAPMKILCSKCKQFYGTEATQGFCSVCFKTEGKKTEISSQVNPSPSDEKTEEVKSDVVKAETVCKPVQDKKDHCWKCQKKVGYLGFSCKCGYVFCGVHRHFSEHNCDFDYKTMERERLIKENPLVSTKKV